MCFIVCLKIKNIIFYFIRNAFSCKWKFHVIEFKTRVTISGKCFTKCLHCRYGSASYKAPVATVLDPNGKLCVTLTYGKLLSRSHKIAYTLLNKALSRGGDCCLKPGDRIALVYPNNDPISFMCAFYGCLQAGIVPVPIEVPLTRRDAGSQQIGFLLGSCGIQV